jgi:hypothetical protein
MPSLGPFFAHLKTGFLSAAAVRIHDKKKKKA